MRERCRNTRKEMLAITMQQTYFGRRVKVDAGRYKGVAGMCIGVEIDGVKRAGQRVVVQKEDGRVVYVKAEYVSLEEGRA